MREVFRLAAIAALVLGASRASAQSVTYNFEDGTDQGFGHKFSNDASESFPIENVGGSNRMKVVRTPNDFQEAERNTGTASDPLYQAMSAASANEAGYLISYDYWIDTAAMGAGAGTFLQVGTYVNTGSGYYAQNFGTPKELELNADQLASGQVFSGTVSQTFAAKGFDIPAGETFFRLGLIINGDGANQAVYFDNITVQPVPEPGAALVCLGAALGALGWRGCGRRRTSRA
jgi:hypothetical protein